MNSRHFRRRDSIAIRLILAIIGFSSFIAVFTTAVQLFVDYRQGIYRIDRELNNVEAVNLAPISESLWSFSGETVQLQLDSLVSHSEVDYAMIRVDGKITWRAGQEPEGDVIKVQYPLVHGSGTLKQDLGNIQIVAGISRIYQQLFEKALVILGTNLVKTLAVAAFMYFLFHIYFTRHLMALGDYARRMSLKGLGDTFRFAGKKSEGERADEFDDIASAMNQMRTNLKESYDELVESEERFKDIANASADWFWEMGPDLRFTYLSERFFEITGFRPEETIGTTRTRYVDPTDREADAEKWAAHLADIEAHKPFKNFEYYFASSTGRVCHARISGTPIFGSDGEFLGYRGTGTDVTERKRAEEALRESEARFRTLVEHAPEAITMLDVDTGLYLDANPMAEALHGLPRDELIGKIGPADLSPEIQPDGRSSSEAAPDYLRRALAGEFPRFEWMHLDPDGQETLCEVSLARLPDPHRNLVRASITDITERKAAEEQLRQAQKMEAVGQLTAGVAHDFNNLLAVILGNAELLEDKLGEDNPQLATVYRTTKRAADLTQRLLAFSRKQVLNPEIINVNGLIADITGLLRRTLEEHIDIKAVTATDLWNCQVDSAQLENAILNLAINARDAMPEGGKLTIETSNLRLDDEYAAAQAEVAPGEYVMLAVSDSGTGMAPEVLGRIFEPFFTTKDIGKGTGLGLAMIYGFVKQSGGHVTVYSEEGEGTTFKLYLPRSEASEVEAKTRIAGEVPRAQPGETVLVVEDDADLRSLVVTMLDRLGYTVHEAGDGNVALDILDQVKHVDLILSDVVLPGGMNGPALAIAARRKCSGLKVLYMTGYAADTTLQQARGDSGAAILRKPFTMEDLARNVWLLLHG